MDELDTYLGSRIHGACPWLDGSDGEVWEGFKHVSEVGSLNQWMDVTEY